MTAVLEFTPASIDVAPTPQTAPFWEGLRRRELRLPRCRDCRSWVFYPRGHCPACLGRDLDWQCVGGNARLVSWTVTHRPTAPRFAEDVPQRIAIVELDEGVRMTTTLVGVGSRELHEGLRCEPVFDDSSPGTTLLRFRPALSAEVWR